MLFFLFCFVFHFFDAGQPQSPIFLTETHHPHFNIKKLPMVFYMIFPIFCTLLKYLIILSMIFSILLTPINHGRLYFYSNPPSSHHHKKASHSPVIFYDFSNILYTIIYSIFLVEYFLLYCSVFSLVYVILSLLSNFLFWSSTLLLFASVFTLGIFIYCDYSVFNGLWFLISLW